MKSWVVSLFRSVCVALTTVSIVFAGVPAQAFGMPLNNEVAESGSTSGQGGAGSLEEAANEQGSSGSTDGNTASGAGSVTNGSSSTNGQSGQVADNEPVNESEVPTKPRETSTGAALDTRENEETSLELAEEADDKKDSTKEDVAHLEALSEEELLEKGDSDSTLKAEASSPSVSVLTHVQKKGWATTWTLNGATAGTVGNSLRMEALRLRLDNLGSLSGAIRCRAHVQREGWQNWVGTNEVSGSVGKARRMEAVQIKLEGELAKNYDVWYRVHCQRYGWMGWAHNGETAGTAGKSLRLEAIQIVLVKSGSGSGSLSTKDQKTAAPFVGAQEIRASAHVQRVGWMPEVGNGSTAGTTGRGLRLEALRMSLGGVQAPGDVEVSAHVQREGWKGWVRGGGVAGTTGKSLRMEAVKMHLTGEAASMYDLYYRVHVQSFGWLAWAGEDEVAGTEGLALRMEAVQAVLVPQGGAKPSDSGANWPNPSVGKAGVTYATQSSGGWQAFVSNGAMSGSTGRAIPLTGFRATLETRGSDLSGSIRYKTHVQGAGWLGQCSDGAVSGMPEAGRRIEAIQISISGSVAKAYDVWYRTHVQGYGWLGWTRNGASAGTVGMGKRVEAVQVRLVPRQSAAPGSTTRPFVDGTLARGLDAASGARSVVSFGGHQASRGAVDGLNGAINALRRSGYDVGFIMMDIESHKGVAYNCDALFYGASSIKAPYIASVVNQHPNAVRTNAYDITETLFYSWDYNYKNVLAAYGKGPMYAWCSEAGVSSRIADELPWVTYSARELAKLWARSYLLFSQSAEGEQFGRWCERPNISTIHNALGGAYRTRTKAGWIDAGGYVYPGVNGGGQLYRVSDDGGIVYAHNGPYVMAIMSSVPANHNVLDNLTRAIDRAHSEM